MVYKLDYANRALQNFTPESDLMKKAVETLRSSARLLFNVDVFFSFSYSALDVVAWIPHIVYNLPFLDKDVNFNTIVEYLATPRHGKKSPYVQLSSAKKDTGWIGQFSNYRHYVTHYGLLSNGTTRFSFNEGA